MAEPPGGVLGGGGGGGVLRAGLGRRGQGGGRETRRVVVARWCRGFGRGLCCVRALPRAYPDPRPMAQVTRVSSAFLFSRRVRDSPASDSAAALSVSPCLLWSRATEGVLEALVRSPVPWAESRTSERHYQVSDSRSGSFPYCCLLVRVVHVCRYRWVST